MIDTNAKWIWINDAPQANEFAYFEEHLVYNGGAARFLVCAETDYILFVNGERVSFGQLAGYPDRKYYDEIDITPMLTAGDNVLRLTVRYEGLNSATHIEDGAGVIYSLSVDGRTVLYSSARTACGYEGGYVQGVRREISDQIGYATDFCLCESVPSVAVEQHRQCRLLSRPVRKLEIGAPLSATAMADREHIYDLGRETAGYLFVRFRASKAGVAKITYGQHLADGEVRYIIGARNFSFDFHLEAGEHEFEVLFVRVSGRYLQAILPEGVEVAQIGLLPALYPQKERGLELEDPLEQRIYDISVRTLRLCMNMHYEDTPWREQALYVMDSRNQMLCGYYAFEEYEFQRANLVYMTHGRREDGLLELTFPAVNTPAIPFFSLMYPVAVWEYVKHTGDESILEETMETMRGIMNLFRDRIGANGLITSLPAPYWNFYEWSEGSADRIPRGEMRVPYEYEHLILNCAYVYAAERFAGLCALRSECFESNAQAVKAGILREFYCEETGVFALRSDKPSLSSQLGNAFALLIGLGDGRTLRAVQEDASLIPATLSMLAFVYDAMLQAGEEAFVLADIRQKYGYMLDCGATSFWETIVGEQDFHQAGSLCHGWSAMPAYYYHLLRKKS